jgi:DNA-directed RNA polymerase III subunit RPC4
VPSLFLQHLVHLDTPNKSANVLGEVNKHYVLTPDIDRLLKELWLNDGETPADKAKKVKQAMEANGDTNQSKNGLMKMEDE